MARSPDRPNAVICGIIIVFLVLVAVCAPLITRFFDIYWDVSDPNAPNTTDVLDFDGYPKVGPPFHGFTWDHPLGVAPRKGYDNLAYLVYGLRTSLAVGVSSTVLALALLQVVAPTIFSRLLRDRRAAASRESDLTPRR